MGHLLFVSTTPSPHLEEIARWTLHWILQNEIQVDSTIYACHSVGAASESIAKPLSQGNPPALVVLNHPVLENPDLLSFGALLRASIPETWILDLIETDSTLPQDREECFCLRKPLRQSDWEDVLAHIFLKASTPQWSRANA